MRGVYWLIEQPMTSLLWHFPSMVIMQRLHGRRVKRIHVWLGAYGHPLMKPIHLLGTIPTHAMQTLKRPKPVKRHKLGHRYYARNGKWVTGGKLLRSSADYGSEFGESFAAVFTTILRQ